MMHNEILAWLTKYGSVRYNECMKPTVPEVLPLVKAYCSKPENGVGGSLHIVLDDGNVHDSHVQYCIDYAKERGDEDGVNLGGILLKMSKTQRLKLAERMYG